VKKFPVAVVGGGWSGERSVSLRSLDGVASALRERGWSVDAIDLLPDRGAPKPATPRAFAAVRLSALLQRLRRRPGTFAFLTLHGPGGEDGRLQGLLDLAGVPYSGSGALASALAMDKDVAKLLLKRAGIPVPASVVLRAGDKLPAYVRPVVVKPVAQGSTLGVTIARSAGQLKAGVAEALKWDSAALVEEFLPGREFTVGVLGGRALPVVEVLAKGGFYDFEAKYSPGGSRHVCPAPLTPLLARKMADLALASHRALGCRAYSRTDVMLTRAGRPVVLEVNTLPGMTGTSLLPDAAKAAGLSYGELLEEMILESLKEAAWPFTKD
jgi:D-alanine-D-alanine ligase